MNGRTPEYAQLLAISDRISRCDAGPRLVHVDRTTVAFNDLPGLAFEVRDDGDLATRVDRFAPLASRGARATGTPQRPRDRGARVWALMAKKRKAPTTRNAADSTLRNVRASNKRDEQINARLDRLEQRMRDLEALASRNDPVAYRRITNRARRAEQRGL